MSLVAPFFGTRCIGQYCGTLTKFQYSPVLQSARLWYYTILNLTHSASYNHVQPQPPGLYISRPETYIMIMKGAVRAVRILCRQSTISTSIAFTSAVRECSIDLTIQISLLADGELVFIELVSVGQLKQVCGMMIHFSIFKNCGIRHFLHLQDNLYPRSWFTILYPGQFVLA